jgi:MFS transporter, ACS family, tartrate transporter
LPAQAGAKDSTRVESVGLPSDLILNSPPDCSLKSAVVSKVTRRLVPFLFLLYIVAYLDRINVGFAALQMQQQLGFNDAVYGLGAGVFFAGYFLFQVPSNLVLARVGARRWIAGLMLVWGIISASMVFVGTARSFYALRFLLGASEAGFFPGMILYLKNWFPATARARTVAWFMTAAPLSGVVGGPISGALLSLHHYFGLAGWQWLFLMEGLPAVVLGGVVLLFLTDYPRDAHWLSDAHRLWLVETLERERREADSGEGAFAAFTLRSVWLLCFVYFALTTCSYGIMLWLPKVIRSLSSISDIRLGVLSVVPYVVAAIAMVLVGFHSDRSQERRWHVAVPAFAGGLAMLGGARTLSLVLVIVALSVAMASVESMCGPFWAMPAGLLSGEAAAAGIAMINSVGNLGGFFGPYIIGVFRKSTGEFKGGLLVIGLLLCLSGGVALLVRGRGIEPRA